MNWLALLLAAAGVVTLAFVEQSRREGGMVGQQAQTATLIGMTEQAREQKAKLGGLSKMTPPEVPFASQAPLGEWSDPRQQDGCEEAAMIMVYCAKNPRQCPVKDNKIDQEWMRRKIIEAHEYQTRHFGLGIDTSAWDTWERLWRGFWGQTGGEVVEVKSQEQIKQWLEQGKLVVVPTNGKKLMNPNFRNGGPARHMLVIKGYLPASDEFVTNDPGTKRGEGYRYPAGVLFEAIRDYPTGSKEKITGEKKMAVVF